MFSNKRGVSLLILIITIVVILILSTTIIINIVDTNLITNANQATFKSDVSQINESLKLLLLDKIINNDKCKTIDGNLSDILGSNNYNKYLDKLIISNSELIYIGDNEKEIKWALDMGIKVQGYTTDEDLLAKAINETKSIAIENGQITRYQYPYRITGELKKTIEKRLGRPIDYSIDRFYIVNQENVLPEIDKDRLFIYSDNSKIVVEVKEKTTRNVATWFWKGLSDVDTAIIEEKDTQDEFLDKLQKYNISQIYLSQRFDGLVGNIKIKEFVANAYSRDIKVYMLTGDENALDEGTREKSIYYLYDTLAEYNNSVQYNERIAGISYNAEFWLNSDYDWKNSIDTRNKHIQYIKETSEYAQNKNLEVIFTLPFWIVQYNCSDINGNQINMFDEISKTLSDVNLMLYRDSADKINNLISNIQGNAEKSILQYINENGCSLNIGVESNSSNEGDNVTCFEEELSSQGYIMTQLQKLENKYTNSWDNFTFSIHHATVLMDFLGGISYSDSIKIDTSEELINFLSGTGNYSGKTYTLSADIDMNGYTVLPYNNTTDGFMGTLDGNNYAIKNLIINSEEAIGLFKKIGTTGVVKNLTIKNSNMTTTAYNAGGIAGTNSGTIINCANENTIVTGKQYVGGIVGRNYGQIKNSYNTGAITCTSYYVGGIAGKNESSGTIYNVYNIGTTTEKGADGANGSITAQNAGTLQKSYWLQGSSARAIGYKSEGETIEMTESEMKKSSFVNTLNLNLVENTEMKQWKIDNEGKYPHF